jgi:hypothetical protein
MVNRLVVVLLEPVSNLIPLSDVLRTVNPPERVIQGTIEISE